MELTIVRAAVGAPLGAVAGLGLLVHALAEGVLCLVHESRHVVVDRGSRLVGGGSKLDLMIEGGVVEGMNEDLGRMRALLYTFTSGLHRPM